MLSEKKLQGIIEALLQRIKYLEDNDPDNPRINKLKLQLFFLYH